MVDCLPEEHEHNTGIYYYHKANESIDDTDTILGAMWHQYTRERHGTYQK